MVGLGGGQVGPGVTVMPYRYETRAFNCLLVMSFIFAAKLGNFHCHCRFNFCGEIA